MYINEIGKIFQAINGKISCPQCGKKYSFENIHIVNLTKNICFLQLECRNHLPTFASVVINDQEIKNQNKIEKITTDEVLSVYYKLQKIKSIKELFN